MMGLNDVKWSQMNQFNQIKSNQIPTESIKSNLTPNNQHPLSNLMHMRKWKTKGKVTSMVVGYVRKIFTIRVWTWKQDLLLKASKRKVSSNQIRLQVVRNAWEYSLLWFLRITGSWTALISDQLFCKAPLSQETFTWNLLLSQTRQMYCGNWKNVSTD